LAGDSSVSSTDAAIPLTATAISGFDPQYLGDAEDESLRSLVEPMGLLLVRRIGIGGMGVVYEAFDENRRELVALKTMRRTDPRGLVRFKQEFRALCDLSHPNLANLYQLFSVGQRWFFTMELIEGSDFLTYVRGAAKHEESPTRLGGGRGDFGAGVARATDGEGGGAGPGFDEERLRGALAQLIDGVEALHAAGKLHRDIKPSNVMVSSSGRVVLLDFGLIADLAPSGVHRPEERRIAGTIAQMSPEQAMGLPVTTASDWYSVGVMLYQALTGRLPYEGTFSEILIQKRTIRPAAPGTLVRGLPNDLEQVCMSLLDPDPTARPSGSLLLRKLRGKPSADPRLRSHSRAVALVGRDPHRSLLESAFGQLLQGKPSSVFLLGKSGMGKTTLLRSFLADLEERKDAIVLSGRCYERESVPFKALDSIADALARQMQRSSLRDLRRVLPAGVQLLPRLFQVLQSVEPLARAGPLPREVTDPQELRRLAFAEFRELFARLGAEAPMVVAIDDLQWGDIDSALLLADLIFSPNPLPLLFVGCFRAQDAERNRFCEILRTAARREPGAVKHHELMLDPLTLAESRLLAMELLGNDDPVSRAHAHLIARESEGNPMFIGELVNHLKTAVLDGIWNAPGSIDLEVVLRSRISAQPLDARRLLEVVAVSGTPVDQEVAFRAAGLGGGGGRAALAALRAARLARSCGVDSHELVEIEHDRVREALLATLEPAEQRGIHRRIAEEYEASGRVDPKILADHLRGAGDEARAVWLYAEAADRAAESLAFDQAVNLYRTALDLHGGGDPPRHLQMKLASALANAGRGAEAAEAYARAAEGAPASLAVDLRRLAATQLLISGRVDEGLSLLRTILKPLRIRMPSSPWRALVSLSWHRWMLQLRGLEFRRRDESQVPPDDLVRIELFWSAVAGLSLIDPILGADFQARGLLLALRAGDPFRIVRALAMEAAHVSVSGNSAARRAEKLIAKAEAVAASLDDPGARGMIRMAQGTTSLMVGQWSRALTALEEAESLFRNHCTGVTWERDTVQCLSLWSVFSTGRIADLRRRYTRLQREAVDRGDRYLATTLTAFYKTMLQLAANDPRDLESELDSLMSHWTTGTFFLQHWALFRSRVHLDLYRGRVEAAWNRVHSVWPVYVRSLLPRIQLNRVDMLELRGRTALAVAETISANSHLIERVEKVAEQLHRETLPLAHAHAAFLRAGAAACRNDSLTTLHWLEQAAQAYHELEMPLHAEVLRYKMGEILGGEQGRKLVADAQGWMRSESIESPTRWSRMYAPGFSAVAVGERETGY